jgi:hypothetical protein
MRRMLVFVAAIFAAGVVCATAAAAQKQLWYDPKVDAVASDIAGTSVRVDGEDDWSEWASFVTPSDPYAVLGFTLLFVPSSSPLYHRIFITPAFWPYLRDAVEVGAGSSTSSFKTAIAILTMIHEAYHIKLYSGDEGRVNACALQVFPSVLARNFGLSPTNIGTTQIPVTAKVRVKRRVKVHGHWVKRYRWLVKTTYETTSTTVPNEAYNTLVANANDFYHHYQSAPYNTGTCW